MNDNVQNQNQNQLYWPSMFTQTRNLTPVELTLCTVNLRRKKIVILKCAKECNILFSPGPPLVKCGSTFPPSPGTPVPPAAGLPTLPHRDPCHNKARLRLFIPLMLKHKVTLSETPRGKIRSIFVPLSPSATTNTTTTAPRSCCLLRFFKSNTCFCTGEIH